jgi:hypothetical protein
VVAGNGRLTAMLALGWPKCQVRLVDWDDAKCREYSIAANRTGELATWDLELLETQLEGLKASGVDLDDIGFGQASLDGLFAQDDKPTLLDGDGIDDADVDDVPTRTQRGDIWVLGGNRLMRGDSTSLAHVARLMDGALADVVFTSPPYDQQRDYGAKITDWQGLMREVFGTVPTKDDAHVLVSLGLVHRDKEWQPYWDPRLAWMREQGWRRFGWYIRGQGPELPGDWNGRLAPAHEYIFQLRDELGAGAQDPRDEGATQSTFALRTKDGTVRSRFDEPIPTQPAKIPDSVLRIMRHKGCAGGTWRRSRCGCLRRSSRRSRTRGRLLRPLRRGGDVHPGGLADRPGVPRHGDSARVLRHLGGALGEADGAGGHPHSRPAGHGLKTAPGRLRYSTTRRTARAAATPCSIPGVIPRSS